MSMGSGTIYKLRMQTFMNDTESFICCDERFCIFVLLSYVGTVVKRIKLYNELIANVI